MPYCIGRAVFGCGALFGSGACRLCVCVLFVLLVDVIVCVARTLMLYIGVVVVADASP